MIRISFGHRIFLCIDPHTGKMLLDKINYSLEFALDPYAQRSMLLFHIIPVSTLRFECAVSFSEYDKERTETLL